MLLPRVTRPLPHYVLRNRYTETPGDPAKRAAGSPIDSATALAMSKRIPNSRTFYCELATEEVTLKWNEVVIADGLVENRWRTIGLRSCTGKGTNGCPVGQAGATAKWNLCPHSPKQ